jgi:hypothetical protein
MEVTLKGVAKNACSLFGISSKDRPTVQSDCKDLSH